MDKSEAMSIIEEIKLSIGHEVGCDSKYPKRAECNCSRRKMIEAIDEVDELLDKVVDACNAYFLGSNNDLHLAMEDLKAYGTSAIDKLRPKAAEEDLP